MGIKLIKKTNEAAYTAVKNPGQAAFLLDCGTPEKAKELNDAFYEVAFVKNGWEPNKAVIGGELIQGWNVGQYFTACVDPCDKAAAWCEEWLRNSGDAAPGIQGNSAREDRRGTDRYGHHVKRFTTKDLGNTDPTFGRVTWDYKGAGSVTSEYNTDNLTRIVKALADMPIEKASIEKALAQFPPSIYPNNSIPHIAEFEPDIGVCRIGCHPASNIRPSYSYKNLELRWNPEASEGTFTDTFRIQYLDEFDPEYSGKEVMIKGTGTDRRSAEKDAVKKFYDEHPDAEIHAIR